MLNHSVFRVFCVLLVLLSGFAALAEDAPPTPPPGVILPPHQPLPPTSPEVIKAQVAAIQSYYAGLGDFQVSFTQRYTSKLTKRVKVSEGTADFARPQKMRWDYLKPDKRSFISDGASFWMVLWEEKEAKVHRDVQTSDLEGSVAFLWGGGNISERFSVTRLNLESIEDSIPVKGRILLELIPIRDSDPFDTLYLLLDPASHRIEEVAFIDQLGNLNHLVFSLPQTDKTFAPEHFRFSAPGKDWAITTFTE